MSKFEWTFFIGTILATLIQIWALYLCGIKIKFTRVYSKKWSMAFWVFFFTMSITLLRRLIIIGDTTGVWDLPLSHILAWSDHIFIPLFNSIGWVIFLTLLLKFWREFFAKYFPNGTLGDVTDREKATTERDNMVTKRENVATEREGLASKREEDVLKKETK